MIYKLFKAPNPLLIGVLVFALSFVLVECIVYQQYAIQRKAEHEVLENELSIRKDKLRSVLHHNISTANAVAFIYKKYGVPESLDSLGKDLFQSNPYIDAIQITQKGITTGCYPLKGNEVVIGFNVLADSARRVEALKTIRKGEIHFAGPYKLIQGGGKAIVGRVPVFKNNQFLGFSVVLIKLSTILRALELGDGNKKFVCQLSKVNPNDHKTEYFLSDYIPGKDRDFVSAVIPEGNWILYVSYDKNYHQANANAVWAILGLLFSVVTGLWARSRAKLPEKLKNVVWDRTLQLYSSEKYYRTIIETSTDAIVILAKDGKILYETPSVERITGYSLADLQSINGLDLIHPEKQEADHKAFAEMARTPHSILHTSHRLLHKNGHYIWLEGTYRNLLHDEHVKAIVFTCADVTLQNLTEQKLYKYNRELILLNEVNDIILNTDQEDELCKKVCNAIVVNGGYKLTWICSMPDENDPEQLVTPIVAYGEVDYIKGLTISLKDENTGNGPTGIVLKTGKPVITNNITEANNFKPWLKTAQQYGIAASIVLPLVFDENRAAAINIYSSQKDAFDKNEVSILKRVASNLSLAIKNIRTNAEKERTALLLKKRIKELACIYRVNEVLRNENGSLDVVLNIIVNLLPDGWQYPEVCEARIVFDDKQYCTIPNCTLQSCTLQFTSASARQRSEIITSDGKTGFIEVVYTEPKPDEYENAFFKEERDLIDTLAELLVSYYNNSMLHISLKKSEANLSSVFNNTNVGHLLLDRNYQIIAFNQTILKGFKKFTGVTFQLNKNIFEQLLPERVSVVLQNFETVLSTKKPVIYEAAYDMIESPQYFNVGIVPILQEEEVIGYSMALTNITKQKLLELEKKQMIDDLLQKNRDLEQFAHVLSHTVRAPLATIMGLYNLFKEDPSGENMQLILQGIGASAEQLDEVVKDMNRILQLKKGGTEKKETVNLTELVKSVIQSGLPGYHGDNATISYDFSSVTELLTIRSYLHDIIYQILSNSIKFTQGNIASEISMWSEQRDGKNYIYAKDNGRGIDMNKYGKDIFGLYKRFDFDVAGKGIGLFMVKTQVEAMNGSVNIQSEPNKETTIELGFPHIS